MNTVTGTLVKDVLALAFFAVSTAGLVIMLGTESANLMPALMVLAFMTPMVASAAVKLKRDLDRELRA
jgi:hypothetical protein